MVSNVRHYSICFCLQLIVMFILFSISFFDYINMLNNGYIQKDAIYFVLDESEEIKLSNESYILYQYHPDNPNIKYVINSGNIKLPPFKGNWSSEFNNIIVGNYVPDYDVPKGNFNLLYFDVPNSYLLNYDIWIVSTDRIIKPENGTHFIYNTPNNGTLNKFKETFSGKNYTIVEQDEKGTYVLNSNMSLLVALKLMVFLIFISLIIITTIWILNRRKLVRILYMYGFSPFDIIKIFMNKIILPYIKVIVFILFIGIMIHFVYPLWSVIWMAETVVFVGIWFLYGIILVCGSVQYYTKYKGERKY